MNALTPTAVVAATDARACVTGWGKSDTHAVTLSDGEPNPHPSAGTPYATITPPKIAAMVANPPPAVPKDRAQWFIPSSYAEADARNHDVQRKRGLFHWLALDLDKGDPSLETVRDAVAAVSEGAAHLIYSTSSATADRPKWRVLVPVVNTIPGADYQDTQDALCDLIEAQPSGLICDRAVCRAGQPIYLPQRPSAFYAHDVHKGRPLDLTPDHPIIRRREEQRARRAQAEAEARAMAEVRAAERRARQAANPMIEESPVDAFNRDNVIADLLESYGYVRCGNSDDWRSPMQTSGSFATRDYGTYWTSMSGSDAAAGIGRAATSGGQWGDAFDLFVHFKHGGDFPGAVAAYGKELRDRQVITPPSLARHTPPVIHDPADAADDDGDDAADAPAPDAANYVRDRKGRVTFCVENVCLIFERHADWQGRFAYNVETRLHMVMAPLPGTRAPRSTFRPRPRRDADLVDALRWFNRNGFPDATKAVLADAVDAVSLQTELSPVAHYLRGLVWDGVPRIGRWLAVYGGAAGDALTNSMGRKWLVAAVARALRPGCKSDHVLVLEGAQGVGKSSALRILAGEAHFHDGLPDLQSKDAAAALRGKWIVELAELGAVRKSDVEMVKAFLTRQEERFRPAYGRDEVIEPRRCIFAATTNRNDWNADETGGRRFWPVPIKGFDLDALSRDRDQLWAEAVHAFSAGESWWLDADLEAEAKGRVAERGADEPWSAPILALVANKAETNTGEILQALDVPKAQQTKSHSYTVARILIGNGWERAGKVTSGPFRNAVRYTRRPTQGGA